MKRDTSGNSLIVGIDKPAGVTSHDVVNACRRIFGERRVGHMGTLDPLASGVLPVAVGSATRLNSYLSEHDKSYRVTCTFGTETDTDDAQGTPKRSAPVPDDLLTGDFAARYVAGLVGEHLQVPPQYSAIKVAGKKAYEQARKGEMVALDARPISITRAALVKRHRDEHTAAVCWVIDLDVSKGTYIRALVRDIGRELGCYAHVSALERTRVGALSLVQCVSLGELESMGARAALDPLRLLSLRFAFCDDVARTVENGNALSREELALQCFVDEHAVEPCSCCCATTMQMSAQAPEEGELVGIVVGNKLKALYTYEAKRARYRATCVFQVPVMRMWH